MSEEVEDDGWITLYPKLSPMQSLREFYDKILDEELPDWVMGFLDKLK